MSIFISIASYRDEELPKTVKSLYDNADNPNDLMFGIVSQDTAKGHKRVDWLGDQVKFVEIGYKDARGAGYARKLAMELYDGEDYFFQVDSHMRFARGWDTSLKNMLTWCQKEEETEKIILSQFAAPYSISSNGQEYFPTNDKYYWSAPSWTSVVNTWQGVWAGNREKLKDKRNPNYSHTVLGGLLFAPGFITQEIPYDPRISFMGEELCFALRAYTRGWHIYAPHQMLAWHFYKREHDPKIWKDKVYGEESWTEIEMESQRVQKDVLLGIEQGIYGIGNYEKYIDYQKMIGINFSEFYAKKLNEKVNLGTISQEVVFDETFNLVERTMSGYCSNGFHSRCFAQQVCDCICHAKERDNGK